MNIVFFGNGNFGINTIKAIKTSKQHKILTVVTDSPKPSGRGLKKDVSKLALCAESLDIKITYQDDISSSNFITILSAYSPDIFIVIDYKIIPEELLNIPKLGCINLHASLLPNYKGASPIQRALMNNDSYLGITTFFINNKIDDGKLIQQKKVKVQNYTTYSEAYALLSKEGSILMNSTLTYLSKNNFKLLKQPKPTIKCIYKDTFTTYAKKIHKDEYKIDFNLSSLQIHNKIRALTMPGCYTYYNSKRIKLFETYYSNKNNMNLTIGQFSINENKKLVVGCKSGTLIVNKVQIEGKKIIDSLNFYNNNNNNNNKFVK